MVARVSEEHGHPLPRGYWGPDQARPILDKVLVTPYDVALDGLSEGERGAVDELLEAGLAVTDLDEDAQHHQALRARGRLQALHDRLGRPKQTAGRNLMLVLRRYASQVGRNRVSDHA